jgi:hypothetical protein
LAAKLKYDVGKVDPPEVEEIVATLRNATKLRGTHKQPGQ